MAVPPGPVRGQGAVGVGDQPPVPAGLALPAPSSAGTLLAKPATGRCGG